MGGYLNIYKYILILLFCSCAFGVNQIEMVPYDEYPQWWSEVLKCMKKQEDMYNFNRLKWIRVEDPFTCFLQENVFGCWVPPHTIYLVIGVLRDRVSVKHEMIHDILAGGFHSNPAFKCQYE